MFNKHSVHKKAALLSSVRSGESGSALVYILIAVALLAALTATFMRSSNEQPQAQANFRVASTLNSQIQLVRSAIQDCVLTYPAGDTSGGAPTDNKPYPLEPDNAYLDTPAADKEVRNIRCPGNPGDSNDHAPIFGGTTGRYMPPPPPGFGQWTYANDADATDPDGIYFQIESVASDVGVGEALNKLADDYATCEVDINYAGCTTNCLRYWMIRTTCP